MAGDLALRPASARMAASSGLHNITALPLLGIWFIGFVVLGWKTCPSGVRPLRRQVLMAPGYAEILLVTPACHVGHSRVTRLARQRRLADRG